LDEKTRDLEQRTTQLHDQSLAVSQRAEALRAMTSQVSGMRQSLRGVLLELDQALDG
jgi:predicted phage tail protein